MANIEHRWRCIELAEQDGRQSNDLGKRVRFTEDAGAEIPHTYAGVENGGDDEDSEVAPKDQHGDTARD